jgi:phosphohistidine phosphatase
MKLYLVQHGEALSEEEDPKRPLSERGRGEVGRIAGLLEEAGLRVQEVQHSGKLRAAETAAILAGAVAGGNTSGRTGIAPLDPVAPLLEEVNGLPDDDELMVVGHMPFVSRAVSTLICGNADRPVVTYRPGGVVCLDRADHRWTVAWMLVPAVVRR